MQRRHEIPGRSGRGPGLVHRLWISFSIASLLIFVGCDGTLKRSIQVELTSSAVPYDSNGAEFDIDLNRALRIVDTVAARHDFVRERDAERGKLLRRWTRYVPAKGGQVQLTLDCTRDQRDLLRLTFALFNARLEPESAKAIRTELTERLSDELGPGRVGGADGSRSDSVDPPDATYAEAIELIRVELLKQFPSLPIEKKQVLLSTQPKVTGHYRMGGSYGQYFFEWEFHDRSRLLISYTGSLNDPQRQEVNIRARVEAANLTER